MRVMVLPDGPAAQADIRDHDKVLSVNGEPVKNWDDLKKAISAHPGETIDVLVERNGEQIHKAVTPGAKGGAGEGKVQIGPATRTVPVGIGEAAKLAVIQPVLVVYGT